MVEIWTAVFIEVAAGLVVEVSVVVVVAMTKSSN